MADNRSNLDLILDLRQVVALSEARVVRYADILTQYPAYERRTRIAEARRDFFSALLVRVETLINNFPEGSSTAPNVVMENLGDLITPALALAKAEGLV